VATVIKAMEDKMMKKTTAITCMILNIDGVLPLDEEVIW
jgi:hypothetical protein